MRPRVRKTAWADDITALHDLYEQEPVVRAWVDRAALGSPMAYQWAARNTPTLVQEAAGDFADLLVDADPIVLQSSAGFRRTTYTYYPAPFLQAYAHEIQIGIQ